MGRPESSEKLRKVPGGGAEPEVEAATLISDESSRFRSDVNNRVGFSPALGVYGTTPARGFDLVNHRR
jgi:hypothetical protein